jgi:hypothetical protein
LSPTFYVDLEARIGSAPVHAVGRLVWVLHGILRQDPGLCALAFPLLRKGPERRLGNLVRVFSDSDAKLGRILQLLSENEGLRGHVRYGTPTRVPENFDGAWIEFRRYRIPNRGSRLKQSRHSRLDTGENIPFLRTTSKNNGHSFSLHIDAVPGTKPEMCIPDSYGLSVTTRSFALPAIG